MMTREDIALEAAVLAAREFEHTIGAITFRLRIPKQSSVRSAYARMEDEPVVAKMADTLSLSLLWIRGATRRDLGLDSDDLLPETDFAAREYVAEHPAAADELVIELYRRMRERYERIEGDAKN